MHPDLATLVAYRDRELGEKPARKVARHLESCPSCARRMEQCASDWELVLAADSHFRSRCTPHPGGLERLRAALERWQQPQADPAQLAELKRRVSAQLELYFGSAAASRLNLEASEPHLDEALVRSVEPLLVTFLGRKAAAAVIGQILTESGRPLSLTPEAI
jgi:hypothetical protein